MVRKISDAEHAAIREAAHKAGIQTSAELAITVAGTSGGYRAMAWLYGLVAGSIAALLLSYEHIISGIAGLLCVQFASIMLLRIPLLLHLVIRMTPVHITHRRCRQRAAEEYLHAAHHLPAGVPFILLYISISERYMHIYGSREVRTYIPDGQWNDVVKTLTSAVRTEGLAAAVVKTVEHAAEMLRIQFPANGTGHQENDMVRIRD